MSETQEKITSVYEPGWGETGKTRVEDAVMVDNPVGLYQLSSENIKLYKDGLLKNNYMDVDPKEIVFFADEEKLDQAVVAMDYAINKLTQTKQFPMVTVVTEKNIPGGTSISTSEKGVMGGIGIDEKYTQTNLESGVKIPVRNFVLYKIPNSSDLDYRKARDMTINEANKTLQLFKADFRIPQFPTDKELPKI